MDYMRFRSIGKGSIVFYLREKGCDIKNVHELNLILEEMGLQDRAGSNWITTDAGMPFTIYNCRVQNPDMWRPTVVEAVYDYLSKNRNKQK